MIERINSPQDLRTLSIEQMEQLAGEIRALLVETVLEQGGHLASNLGVVELTLALEYVFGDPEDRIVFDVGHQAYVHKILTGRREQFAHLRERGGLSGFPRISESEYDAFPAGHASTSISAALGMARARDLMGDRHAVVAVTGDGAMTGGMCYEALNDAGHTKTPLIIVLNDNEMSIAHNVGALSTHLTRLRQSRAYTALRRSVKRGLGRIPKIGRPMEKGISKLLASVRRLLVDDHFFSALGVRYLGPIDGHDLSQLIDVFRGTMSFVGTRPEVTKYVEKYAPEMRATLLLRAGVTSEASICFKDEDELLSGAENVDEVYVEKILPEKMKYNLQSIKKFSCFSDLKTMFRTVFAVLKK